MLFLNKPENLIKIVQVYRQKGHSRPLSQCQKLSTQGRKCNCLNKTERLDPVFILQYSRVFKYDPNNVGLFKQIMLLKIFKGCLIKILLGPFLNGSPHFCCIIV